MGKPSFFSYVSGGAAGIRLLLSLFIEQYKCSEHFTDT